MDDELSLVPVSCVILPEILVKKPMRCYRQMVVVLQRLLDLLTGVRRIRENIPRKETVEAVIAQRRELVKILTFISRRDELPHDYDLTDVMQSLPQFLPSARDALRTLKRSVKEHISKAQKRVSEPLGLPVVYAFAEIRILEDLVQAIEDLLDITRQLFGTSAWYTRALLDGSATDEEALSSIETPQ
ncbi:hypothetical protein H0H87_010263 [Tephrocybe sp. NHM501043]|nr:hypothetical protein H0H87_010263 [Tephrocybe sp. NHM501043]